MLDFIDNAVTTIFLKHFLKLLDGEKMLKSAVVFKQYFSNYFHVLNCKGL